MKDRKTDALNALVEDELSAVETYRRALSRLGSDPEFEELRRIENEHERALTLLQEELAERGEEPAHGGSAWGPWANAIEGAAALFGDEAAFRTLREGEEKSLRDYERALEDDDLDWKIKQLISTSLLPSMRDHLAALDRCLEQRPKRH